MISFAIVGTGWRTDFFLRIAQACSDNFRVVGVVTRSQQRAQATAKQFGVALYESIDELLVNQKPLFVVTSVPWDVNPSVIRQLVERGLPVLSETPPATNLDELIALSQLVTNGAKIQVAEQYWAQPHHAARIAFAHSGKLGSIQQAQISVAHGYHGISLIRRYLGIGFENATISAQRFQSQIVKGRSRDTVPSGMEVIETEQVIATFDFGDKLGMLDFTSDQYFSLIRGQRVLVRGTHGELIDQCASYLADATTQLRIDFQRHQTGFNGNLEGHYLKGIQAGEQWVYRNPLVPAALSDEEIAVATCLLRMAEYADDGAAFYSLAEACQDRYLDILMWQSVEQGQPVRSESQPWSK